MFCIGLLMFKIVIYFMKFIVQSDVVLELKQTIARVHVKRKNCNIQALLQYTSFVAIYKRVVGRTLDSR